MSVIRACSECGGTDRQKCAECGGSGHGPKGACGRCDGQGSVSAASQAAKDLAHLLRLLGVDSYEEATVVLFDLTRRGHLPAAPIDPKDAGAR